MSATLAFGSPSPSSPPRIFRLTGLFWAFSYALLTIRGALFHDDWSHLINDNRLFAVTVGAGAYLLVLRQLQLGTRMTLRSTLAWIVAATLAIMLVRTTIDELMFDVPQGFDVNLLWSLTWSAYFGLWVMGSLAFAPVTAAAPVRPTQISATAAERVALIDGHELLIDALLAEVADLKREDREELARRIAELGGYETVGGPAIDNERARLAIRLAARLSART